MSRLRECRVTDWIALWFGGQAKKIISEINLLQESFVESRRSSVLLQMCLEGGAGPCVGAR